MRIDFCKFDGLVWCVSRCNSLWNRSCHSQDLFWFGYLTWLEDGFGFGGSKVQLGSKSSPKLHESDHFILDSKWSNSSALNGSQIFVGMCPNGVQSVTDKFGNWKDPQGFRVNFHFQFVLMVVKPIWRLGFVAIG